MKFVLPFLVGLFLFVFIACSNADYEALEDSPFEAADKAVQDTSVSDENEWFELVVSSSSESLIDSLNEVSEPFLVSSSSNDSIMYLPLDGDAEERKNDSVSNLNGDDLQELDGHDSELDSWIRNVSRESRFNPEISYDTLVDSRDGKVYKTVKIAFQTWMAENLDYADSVKTESLKGNNWCYHNDTMNCDVVGRYYTWAAAIDSVGLAENEALDCGYGKTCLMPDTVYGICPPGWHLPKEEEWYALFDALGGRTVAGRVLKSQSGWLYQGAGTDSTGFCALPAGRKFVDDYFDYDGLIAYFWSASEYTEDYARFMGLTYDYYWDAFLYTHKKTYGFSVRCMKNSIN